METYLHIIEKDGFTILVSIILIYFLVKYFNMKMNKTPCIQNKRMDLIEKILIENKNLLIEIKSMMQGFFYGFKYKDKNDD